MADPATIAALVQAGYKLGSGIFGGGSKCSSQDKQERARLEQDIAKYLTPQDMENLTQGMQDRVSPTPQAMAYFAFGEDDCLHKNVDSRHQKFLNELPQLLQKRKAEYQQDTGLPDPSGGMGGIPQFQTAGFGLPAIILMVLALGGIAWVSK